ncbi:MAG: transketolase [Flavobacteriaceae bacterium]|nr:transketolase [Flavobacteriaceae bacterium]
MIKTSLFTDKDISFDDYKSEIIHDYKTVVLSRECSILGRREVFLGKGKFGIFGDGKELPQIVLNRFFKNGDFRSGYYRDQTLLMAQGLLTPDNFFAALYAHTDLKYEPMSGGRQMGAHFSTRSIDKNGEWLNLMKQKNHSSDVSPTGSQMPRLVGLAYSSKIYRELEIKKSKYFSDNGNEIAWGTIGNASTSEGMFFEAINAAGVLQIPMITSIWDDEYGISVSNELQTTKSSISEVLLGFERTSKKNGFEILTVNGWDYPALVRAYAKAEKLARINHIPVIIHVKELTQPLGHSSSGSHERYKSTSRLKWEKEYDCILKFKEWILINGLSDKETLSVIDREAIEIAKKSKIESWKNYQNPIKKELENFNSYLSKIIISNPELLSVTEAKKSINNHDSIGYKEILSAGRSILPDIALFNDTNSINFKKYINKLLKELQPKFSSNLYTKNTDFEVIPPKYPKNPKIVDGRIIIRDNFDKLLTKIDNLIIFGEDCGKIGGVNQGLEGLQNIHSEIRVSDTGIREATIIGQGIGMALRGLRPIAEIQYLDYILYCIQILSDDLASLHYRSNAQQHAPLIVRTRGHRLEGIWHSGSPMAAMIHLLRGIYILTPRNMTIAAGMYNSLLKINQPAILIETLNAYRLKEKLPMNIGKFTSPIGEIEVLKNGEDITIITYGATVQLVLKASELLKEKNIDVEVIDLQTLIPFDKSKNIRESLKKTNKLLIVDEDMPGGASAYILQQLLDHQDIYTLLDSEPKLLSAKEHRPPYGTDGDYFTKPNINDIFEISYGLMNESNPDKYSSLD